MMIAAASKLTNDIGNRSPAIDMPLSVFPKISFQRFIAIHLTCAYYGTDVGCVFDSDMNIIIKNVY
jgi:hypothetical protein